MIHKATETGSVNLPGAFFVVLYVFLSVVVVSAARALLIKVRPAPEQPPKKNDGPPEIPPQSVAMIFALIATIVVLILTA